MYTILSNLKEIKEYNKIMEIHLTVEATEKAAKKMQIVYSISNFINSQMLNMHFGKTVDSFIYTLNCYDPNFGRFGKEWENGSVVTKKFVKSQRRIELTVKLNHKSLMMATEDEVYTLIKQAFLKTKIDIEDLNIKGFDHDAFYLDLERLLDVAKSEEGNSNGYFNAKITANLRTSAESGIPEIKEKDFWDIIEQSKQLNNGDLTKQIEDLIDILSKKDKETIFGFELRLRELLRKAYHLNIFALNKVVNGAFADDSFLYFRAKLILMGRTFFYQAITDPNALKVVLGTDYFGEDLLSVSNKAIQKKHGSNFLEELPSDVFDASFNDDFPLDIEGAIWTESEFEKKFRPLLELYKSFPDI